MFLERDRRSTIFMHMRLNLGCRSNIFLCTTYVFSNDVVRNARDWLDWRPALAVGKVGIGMVWLAGGSIGKYYRRCLCYYLAA